MSNADLHRRFEAATARVHEQLHLRQGGQAAENEYSAAYQALVKAGLAPQLRARYRTASETKLVRK
jgi:hypothetical protein